LYAAAPNVPIPCGDGSENTGMSIPPDRFKYEAEPSAPFLNMSQGLFFSVITFPCCHQLQNTAAKTFCATAA
jgi:hypothetical protein